MQTYIFKIASNDNSFAPVAFLTITAPTEDNAYFIAKQMIDTDNFDIMPMITE